MRSVGVGIILAFAASAAAAQDVWFPIPDAGPGQGRSQAVALWTGEHVLVLGGQDSAGTLVNQGVRFNPRTLTWSALSTVGSPAGRVGHSAVWTGREALVWGGRIDNSGTWTQTGGRYDPRTDSWTAISTSGAPSARVAHAAVWTGREMIVWGGIDGTGTPVGDGARYDPVSDAWSPISNTGDPAARGYHGAVWTGRHMLVIGGTPSSTGGRYDPAADAWSPLSAAGAPQPNTDFSTVWTGREMIVWGGQVGTSSTYLDTGARYDPAKDTWAPTSTAGAPLPRLAHTAVWTGREMIVYGGHPGSTPILEDGARYDPLTDAWTALPVTDPPGRRAYHQAVWTGREMIVCGGADYTSTLARLDGGAYRPPPRPRDQWRALSTAGAPEGRSDHAAVWTGREMLVWGGQGSVSNPLDGYRLDSGARYDGAWSPLSSAGAPTRRQSPGAAWTGREMLVLGGSATGVDFGGRYDPAADAWAAVTATGAPIARISHSVVWTGREAIVWGGSVTAGGVTNTGARYDPRADAWTPVTTTGAPSARALHGAVWTGREMIVWGGNNGAGTDFGTGARYDPRTDTWSPLQTAGAPSARSSHVAVWTGAEMIVWGGNPPAAIGARYSPTTDAWNPMSAVNAPPAPYDIRGVWTGEEMLIWGQDVAAILGGRYAPADDAWTSITTSGAPARRQRHTALWTGRHMLVFGGNDGGPGLGNTDTGGAYGDDPSDPAAGTVVDAGAQVDRTSTSAAWSGFSGAVAYAWAIGTTPGAADVLPFTSVGAATSATAFGLALELGRTYYVAVRAVNEEGHAVTSVSAGVYIGLALEADVGCAAGAARPAVPPWALLALLALALRRTSR